MKRKIIILFIILFLTILLGIFKGSVNISFSNLLSPENRPILNLRILRIMAAILVGSGLAVSGIVLQAILRNSLAEPYLLGTSSGAGLGAVIGIVAGISQVYLPAVSFLGAILSIFLVYNLAKQNHRIIPESLVLSGVIVSVAFSAIIVFLISVSSNESLQSIAWWLWGNLQIYNTKLLFAVALIVIPGIALVYLFWQDLNAISIGEEDAMHMGINTELLKRVLILITALITAGLVCLCGIIGFVGLIIPHMMRLFVGPNHKILIPATCVAAAAFMVACDFISRVIFVPVEIPIGVVTALVGAPVFIMLLKKTR